MTGWVARWLGGPVKQGGMAVIDLHAHVLPGIDDGPATWDEALALVRMAAAEGITDMVATPHMMPDGAFANHRRYVLPLVEELRDRLRRQRIDVTIHPGGEVYMSPDLVARLERGELLTYGDAGRYMLVELPASELPDYAERIVSDLVHLGITPIIAHPERNTAIASKPQLARRLVEAGALLQVNASSLRSRHEAREAAKYLLTHGYVHFVATDCHGVYARRPSLGKYVDMLAEWLGPEQAQKLVKDHPAAVLAGARLEPPRILERQGLGAR